MVFSDYTFHRECIQKPTYLWIYLWLRFVRIWFVFVLLRGHIVGCADAGAGKIDFFIKYFWDAKISKFDFIIWDEDIRCFDISM